MNKQITVKNILDVTGGKLICGNENLICEKFSKDTRELNKGEVYVGLQGENFNGSTLYEEALQKGAIVFYLSKLLAPNFLTKFYNFLFHIFKYWV